MKISLGIKTSAIKPEFMKKALIESALIVQGSAKLELNIPKMHANGESRSTIDTGRLIGSISYALDDTAGKVQGTARGGDAVSQPTTPMKAKIGTNVEYAQDIEFKFNENFAFLRKSLYQNEGNIKSIFERALKASVGAV